MLKTKILKKEESKDKKRKMWSYTSTFLGENKEYIKTNLHYLCLLLNKDCDMMEHPLSQFKYCPKCGSARFEPHNGKSKQCADCGFVYYFNSSSATVALILNPQNELLVCRRAKAPAKGTLDLPGGFVDMAETAEEGVAREVKEETGMTVTDTKYLFSLPNIYLYSGFSVHTLDMFFLCTVADTQHFKAMDDAAEVFFVPLKDIRTEDFGLDSIRKGVKKFIGACADGGLSIILKNTNG